jgi:hypothetical protein
MRKLTIGLALAGGLIAIPATSAAAHGNPARAAARRACIAEYHAIGGKAFRLKYGAHGALDVCITQHGGGPPPPPKPHPHPHPHHNPGGDEGDNGDNQGGHSNHHQQGD